MRLGWCLAALILLAGPAAAQGTPTPKDLARGGRAADAPLVIAAVEDLGADPARARALLATYVEALADRCLEDPPGAADLERLLALAESLALDAAGLTALRGCGGGDGLKRYIAVFEGNGLSYAFEHCGADPGGVWDITVTGAMSGRGLLGMNRMVGSDTDFDGRWGATIAMAGMEIDMEGWATLAVGPNGEAEFMIETASATGTGSDGSATAEPNTEVYATLSVTPEDCEPSDLPAP